MQESLDAIRLTVVLAAATTVVLLLLATPLAWWLSQTASRWRLPISALVTLPLVLPPSVLGFAHTVGEFGVVLMIGGNIPGKTRVVSTQIYGHVEAMEYAQAHWLAGGMLVFSFAVLLALSLMRKRSERVMP